MVRYAILAAKSGSQWAAEGQSFTQEKWSWFRDAWATLIDVA
jgi:hypothetical protein